jgi:hypothetical protein
MTNNDFEFNGVEINEDRTLRLLKKVIMEEARNIKSKEKNDSTMAKYIRDLIEEEANVVKIS